MLKILILSSLFFLSLYGADRTIGTKDMSSFVISGDIKEQIKRELKEDLNVTLRTFKQDLEQKLEQKFKSSENAFKLDVVALKKEVTLLKEQIALFQDMIIDTNYQRNLRDDRVRLLMESTKEIEKRLNKLENKKEPPLENKTGEKI